MSTSELLLAAVGVIALSFLAGVDAGFDKADQAAILDQPTQADRARIMEQHADWLAQLAEKQQ